MSRVSRPSSLRRSVLVTLLAVVVPVIIVLSATLFWAVQNSIWTRFDAELQDASEHVAALVEYDDDGYEFELGPEPPPLVRTPEYRTDLLIAFEDGRVLSSSVDSAPAAPIVALADRGTTTLGSTRWLVRRMTPQMEADAAPGTPDPAPVIVAVGRATDGTHRDLERVGGWFLALGLVTLGCAAFAAAWSVRRGLRPVATLHANLDRIDSDDLGARVDERTLPAELAGIAQRTNELLERVQRSFERERRFGADLAHELRTPLSVLKAELELALRRERSPEEYRAALTRAEASADRMTALVDQMLRLARLERDAPLRREAVDLHALVDECWSEYATQASARQLSFHNELPTTAIDADAGLLRAIVSNLLGNAAAYTETGGWIRVGPGTGVFEVIDSGPILDAEAREHMFDRLWRSDESREESAHAGLGLAIVRAAAERHGWSVRAEARADSLAIVIG